MEGWVLSQLSIGSVLVKDPPLSVEAQPGTPNLFVRTAIPIIFTIRNLYSKMIDMQMMLETADMFVFAGNKKVPVISYNSTGLSYVIIANNSTASAAEESSLESYQIF